MTVLLLRLLLADVDIDQAMREATLAGPAAGRARLDAWVGANPASPEVPKARLWQAESWARDGNFAQADRLLAALAAGGSSPHWDAALLRADLELSQRHWAIAEQEYRALAAPPGSRWEYEATMRAEVALWGGRRQHALWAVLAGLVALALYRGVAARRALWPPPEEALWAAPVLGVMLVAAAPRAPEERTAVIAVALAGLALLWINGAWLKSRPLTPARRLAEVGLGLVQTAGALYCAVVASGLWEPVMNTLAAGAD